MLLISNPCIYLLSVTLDRLDPVLRYHADPYPTTNVRLCLVLRSSNPSLFCILNSFGNAARISLSFELSCGPSTCDKLYHQQGERRRTDR